MKQTACFSPSTPPTFVSSLYNYNYDTVML